MILGEQKPGGKFTIHKITRDLRNGAWNNLDLSKSSKRALTTTGLIIFFGLGSSFFLMTRK
tara:strand:- start:4800 stop:4982 length:183 start_codon:yes stop_codon:yes gene_type:complete